MTAFVEERTSGGLRHLFVRVGQPSVVSMCGIVDSDAALLVYPDSLRMPVCQDCLEIAKRGLATAALTGLEVIGMDNVDLDHKETDG